MATSSSAPHAPLAQLRPLPSTTVDQKTWTDEMDRAEISKSDLNALIFDYLLIEGFPDAAIEFARETGMSETVDHEMIQERMAIREAVEEGRVEEAVRRTNELDPEILDTNPPLLFHLHLLHLIELIRLEDTEACLAFAMTELAPRGAQHPEFLVDLERAMALLAFPVVASYADDAQDSPSKPPPDAETLVLLKDPAFEPIMRLMKQAQRVKVAKELNAAILESLGMGMETKLGGLIRLMSWGEERLEKVGVALPPDERDKGRTWADKIFSTAT
ncbi:glucose-induced degradation protein 8, partial [Tremellales sp. Uapishka_1]